MSIKSEITEFDKKLKNTGCKLIAVSKTKPITLIQEAYEAGQLDFGENKVQELREKVPALSEDIRWHMIGHLQSNKVKYIAPYIYMIHAVESIKLLQEIDRQAQKNGRVINCLLQVYIAEEESKFGLSEQELYTLIGSPEFSECKNVMIKGLMGMATYTENASQIHKEFRNLKRIFEEVKQKFDLPNLEMEELSMGMSGDYEIAIEEGSTMIRVGSKIFGSRN